MSEKLLTALRANREVAVAELDEILGPANRARRNLTTAETKRFNAAKALIEDIDRRVEELSATARADAESAREVHRAMGPGGFGTGGFTSPRGGEIYQKGDNSRSFFRDLYRGTKKGDRDAIERLDQNNRLVADATGQQRAINTGSGTGGELVPPLWLMNDWVAFVRPGRITANLATMEPMPSGTDIINIPKVLTGTTTAPMSTQNSAVSQTDLTTTSVNSPVITIAGGQTVSLQLMEQSPLNIDNVIMMDMAADYAKQWDLQVLDGSGSSGQITGLSVLSGTTSITWTQATPSLAGPGGLYAKFAAAVAAINSTRFMPPTAIVMHPRRWGWMLAQSDNAGRPLIVPRAGGAFNAMALPGNLSAEGLVGEMHGLPVYTDANISTTMGSGSNQDYALVLRASDQFAWEGQLRAEAFEQTYASNNSVFVRCYSYAAYIPNRYVQAVAVLTGTGFVTPSY